MYSNYLGCQDFRGVGEYNTVILNVTNQSLPSKTQHRNNIVSTSQRRFYDVECLLVTLFAYIYILSVITEKKKKKKKTTVIYLDAMLFIL